MKRDAGRLLVVSDLHRAGPRERQRRGFDQALPAGWLALATARLLRRYVWLADPMAHNHRLGDILAREPGVTRVVANGDYSLDTAFVGVSDDAAMESAAEALGELRAAHGHGVRGVIGDHELGKKSLVGGAGGPRWRSVERCEAELGLPRLWHEDFPGWRWVGITSTLAAWPVFRAEGLEEERETWERAHREHLEAIDALFGEAATRGRRVVLFCHDPTALPFLARLDGVQRAHPRIAATVIGHLHTPWILRAGGWLAGMPCVPWAGHTVRRCTAALRDARCWRDFRVVLCPSPSGIQLFKDGGYLVAPWPPEGNHLDLVRQSLRWTDAPGRVPLPGGQDAAPPCAG